MNNFHLNCLLRRILPSWAVVLGCGLLLGNSSALWAQVSVSYPDTAPQRGVTPIGSYAFDKLEAISKSSGVLTYTIPLTTMPLGRGGMSLPINLVYNSSQYDYQYSYTYSTDPQHTPILNQNLQKDYFGGWSLNPGYSLYLESKPLATSGDCTTGDGLQRTSLVMPDGSRHVLQFYGFPQEFTGGDGYYPWSYTGQTGCINYTSLTGPITLFTSDGTYIKVVASNSGAWTAYLPNGETITSQCAAGACPNGAAETIADRNGNKISIQYFATSAP